MITICFIILWILNIILLYRNSYLEHKIKMKELDEKSNKMINKLKELNKWKRVLLSY